jgi:tetratricopeptide (TPR) repeat protein
MADATYVHAYGLRGQYSLSLGRLEQAYADFRHVYEQAKDDPIVPSLCLLGFLTLRKFEEAQAIVDRVVKAGHVRYVGGLEHRALAFCARGLICRSRGDIECARESFSRMRVEAERAVAAFPTSATLRAMYAAALTLCGDGSEAIAELDRVEREHPTFLQAAYYRAVICAELHDKEGLLTSLRRLRSQGTVIWWGLRQDIALEPYRNDPDFLQIVGPTAFWQTS